MAPSATPKFCGGRSSGQFFVVSKVKMPMHEDLHEGWFHNTHRPGWFHNWLQPKKTRNTNSGQVQTLGFVCFFLTKRGMEYGGQGQVFYFPKNSTSLPISWRQCQEIRTPFFQESNIFGRGSKVRGHFFFTSRISSWKLTWLAGKSPLLIEDTSSKCPVSVVMLVFGGVPLEKEKKVNHEAPSTHNWSHHQPLFVATISHQQSVR